MHRVAALALVLLLVGAALAADIQPLHPALVKNLATDYGAAPSLGAAKVAELLQKAVDEVGAAGGGTVVIPGSQQSWYIDRPIFIGYPNVTVTGEGTGTTLAGTPSMFVLGIKAQYPQAITSEHYPKISAEAKVLDASVSGTKYGLRTFDGVTKAAGYFPTCALAYGGRITHREGDIYWIDYERGVNKPIFWQEPQYTLNLAVKNNGKGVMKGVICGVGPGRLTAKGPQGDIRDPLNIWTIESDQKSGANLAFKFRVRNAKGEESIQTLPLSPTPIGMGVARISVQLNFTTGACRAWFSLSTDKITPPVLASQVNLGAGYTLKPFQYGAFRFGAVTDTPFSGTPSDGKAVNGDWTFCGMSLFREALYAAAGATDVPGTPQQKIDGSAVTDNERYFPSRFDKRLITYLPLEDHAPCTLVRYCNGQACDDVAGFGYWLPDRPLQPVGGIITVKDMCLISPGWGAAVAVGEARHAAIQTLYQYGNNCHSVGSWDCNPPNNRVDIVGCRLMASDAMVYGKSEDLRISDIFGGGGEADFRLVGCRGEITSVLITAFVAADYYCKLHAGPYGGPLTVTYFCVDNEGMNYVPKRAGIYAEPSLDPGPQGNTLTFRGGYYTGMQPAGSAVVELADPPIPVGAKVSGVFTMDYIDLMSDARKPCDTLIRCTGSHWSGSLLNVDHIWTEHGLLASGHIQYTGAKNQGKFVVYVNDMAALPSSGTWLAGSHIIRIPGPVDPVTGTTKATEYRCVQSGTYGTAQEPRWEAVK